ncbi:S8 family serine peptidase [Haloimpatiens lingqiaonensis]|uniref:S8 family serine peptidase n=1 Tax=Haloimpatiens lingqiaonensis TaxID=1380675 RepID=UPI0010FEE788|nr:S8 family serine peptidase [Haloimpatiens lingqiaonensis]
MLSLKNKMEKNLRLSLNNNVYKNYRVLIHYKALRKKMENKINNYKGSIIRHMESINTFCAYVSPYTLNRLLEHPEIDYACFDEMAILCGEEQGVAEANKISLKGNYKLTGRGIGIGLIDTGVYPHEDLKKPYNKIIEFKDLVKDYKYPYDDNGHGTFISGVLCGSGEASNGKFKGISENSHLYCIKAFNGIGKGYISDILFALETLITESDVNNIKLICLPFEYLNNDNFILSLFNTLFKKADEKGITVLVPAGHNGNAQNSIRGIATLNSCITVGGIDTSCIPPKPYEFSSSGPYKNFQKPDLVAACVDITSLNTDSSYLSERNNMKIYPKPIKNPYTSYTGTSCATAYICGLCALLLENNPNLKFKDILSLLKVSCNLLNMPKNIQGNGVIDIGKLLP